MPSLSNLLKTLILGAIGDRESSNELITAIEAEGPSGADTDLSNLTSPTAINEDLIPDGAIDLGSDASPFSEIHGSDVYSNIINLTAAPQTLLTGGSIISSSSFIALQAATPIDTSTSVVIVAGLVNGQTIKIVNVGTKTITLKHGGNLILPLEVEYNMDPTDTLDAVWYGSSWYTTATSVNSIP